VRRRLPSGEGLGAGYTCGWVALRLLFGLLFRLEVVGVEHVPDEGGCILCPNHIHAIDPPLVSTLVYRPAFHMAKAELFAYLGWVLPRVGAFPVHRDRPDPEAFKMALRLLKAGRVVVIFPEGHRSRTGDFGPPRHGAAHLSVATGAPVVPVRIEGPYRLFGRVRVTFGRPFVPSSKRAGEEILDAIRALGAAPSEGEASGAAGGSTGGAGCGTQRRAGTIDNGGWSKV
jgi:1-acyl-sn-glycerol-3-phosphate acyltransferase